MSTAAGAAPIGGTPELLGQTVVLIGGSSGIGFETSRRARAKGAKLILVGRDPEHLKRAAGELEAQSTASFDATEFDSLERFFNDLPAAVDHVLVTGPGPYYASLAEFEIEKARRDVEAHLFLPLHVARCAAKEAREGRCFSWAARAADARRWDWPSCPHSRPLFRR